MSGVPFPPHATIPLSRAVSSEVVGDWFTLDERRTLVITSIVDSKPVTNFHGFVKTLWIGRVGFWEYDGAESNDGQHNCGVWYRTTTVLKCTKKTGSEMECEVMQRVLPINTYLFDGLSFANRLANTVQGRPVYTNVPVEEQSLYVDTVSRRLNEIRSHIARVVYEFSDKNIDKVWRDFKLDNVGIAMDEHGQKSAVLIDREGIATSSNGLQILPNIEDWGVNGQYNLFNVLELNDDYRSKLRTRLAANRVDMDELIRTNHFRDVEEKFEQGTKYYKVTATDHRQYYVLQWDLIFRVEMVRDENPSFGRTTRHRFISNSFRRKGDGRWSNLHSVRKTRVQTAESPRRGSRRSTSEQGIKGTPASARIRLRLRNITSSRRVQGRSSRTHRS